MRKKNFKLEITLANLVAYARQALGLRYEDSIYATNQLLELFSIAEPAEAVSSKLDLQTDILDPLIDYAIEYKLCTQDTAILFETKIMGFVTPAPSIVVDNFDMTAATLGVEKATDYLNEISINSNYIRMVDINKNIKWTTTGDTGEIIITINLSKPEKTAAQVAAEKIAVKGKYPQCMLCVQNIGFSGSLRHPARQTLRTVPISLSGESWHLQMSPYVYYSNHCIAFADKHKPMAISPDTFSRLLSFVEIFPHYFIGSNADLPIVGGSILSHDHYQGGGKVLPMFNRGSRYDYFNVNHKHIKISIVDWYNSVVRITGDDKKNVETFAVEVLSAWRGYTDEQVGILSNTNGTPHNTITPIATKNLHNEFCLELILRNNRTDEDHPDGIFHPTQDMHNIKKEGIGLIEAMGLFILPGRLSSETASIKAILMGEKELNFKGLSETSNPLSKHFSTIVKLTHEHGTSLSEDDAEKIVTDYINKTCADILRCTAVFKNNIAGQSAFDKFMRSLGCRLISEL